MTCPHRRTKCEPLKFADGRERIVLRCVERDCDQWLQVADKPRAAAAGADRKTIEKRKRKRAPVDKRPWTERGLAFRPMTIEDEWAVRGATLTQDEDRQPVVLCSLPQSNSHGFRRRVGEWLEREPAAVERLLEQAEVRRIYQGDCKSTVTRSRAAAAPIEATRPRRSGEPNEVPATAPQASSTGWD